MSEVVLLEADSFARLVRDSERLNAVTDYVSKSEYVVTNDLKILLGIEIAPAEEKAGEE